MWKLLLAVGLICWLYGIWFDDILQWGFVGCVCWCLSGLVLMFERYNDED